MQVSQVGGKGSVTAAILHWHVTKEMGQTQVKTGHEVAPLADVHMLQSLPPAYIL